MIKLFSDSCNFELSDIHLILGPNTNHFSQPDDFNNDPKKAFYSLDNQADNIEMMHKIVKTKRRAKEEKDKMIRKEQRM